MKGADPAIGRLVPEVARDPLQAYRDVGGP